MLAIIHLFLLFPCVYLDRLLQVQTIFRHGERAPLTSLTSDESRSFFFRGLGMLTDSGIKQGIALGTSIKRRYIDHLQLLDPRMIPAQVSFRSSSSERCLMTAQAVGLAMFNSTPVPVLTTDKERDYTCVPKMCDFMIDEMKTKLEMTSPSRESWDIVDEVSRIIAKQINSTIFNEDSTLFLVEPLLIERKAGLAVPEWFDAKAEKEAEIIMYKSLCFMTGSGVYHNSGWIKSRAGYLLYTIVKNIDEILQCVDDTCKAKKLHMYSTHDLTIMSLLQALNISNQAMGENAYPEFSAAISLELWIRNEQPVVKIFYRQGAEDSVFVEMNLCPKDCTLLEFKNLTRDYVVKMPEVFCNSQNTTSTNAAKSDQPIITTNVAWLIILLVTLVLLCLALCILQTRTTSSDKL